MQMSLIDSNRVILVDWGVFLFRGIFAWERAKKEQKNPDDFVSPAPYISTISLIACLNALNVSPTDEVIICVDSGRSWRKELDTAYKANRKDDREKSTIIDWKYWFKQFDYLMENFRTSTPFHMVSSYHLEADDLIAVAVRLFKEKECVIISSDSDYEQLAVYDNVKLFSPVSKKYKIVKNPYKILSDKIQREKSDNLLTTPTTQAERELREKIVNLITLPPEIEEQALKELKPLEHPCPKSYDLGSFKYPSLKKKLKKIYG